MFVSPMAFSLPRQLSRGELVNRTAKYDDLAAEARQVSMTTLPVHQSAILGRCDSNSRLFPRAARESTRQSLKESSRDKSLQNSQNSEENLILNLTGNTHATCNDAKASERPIRPGTAPVRAVLSRSRRSGSCLGLKEVATSLKLPFYESRRVYEMAYQGKERLMHQTYRFVKKSGSTSEAPSLHDIARNPHSEARLAARPLSGSKPNPTASRTSKSQLCLDIALFVAGAAPAKLVANGRSKSAIGIRTNAHVQSYRDKYQRLAAQKRELEKSARQLFRPRESIRWAI